MSTRSFVRLGSAISVMNRAYFGDNVSCYAHLGLLGGGGQNGETSFKLQLGSQYAIEQLGGAGGGSGSGGGRRMLSEVDDQYSDAETIPTPRQLNDGEGLMTMEGADGESYKVGPIGTPPEPDSNGYGGEGIGVDSGLDSSLADRERKILSPELEKA